MNSGKYQAYQWQYNQHYIHQAQNGLAAVFLHAEQTDGNNQQEQGVGNNNFIPEYIV
jgi:hypothetical protein